MGRERQSHREEPKTRSAHLILNCHKTVSEPAGDWSSKRGHRSSRIRSARDRHQLTSFTHPRRSAGAFPAIPVRKQPRVGTEMVIDGWNDTVLWSTSDFVAIDPRARTRKHRSTLVSPNQGSPLARECTAFGTGYGYRSYLVLQSALHSPRRAVSGKCLSKSKRKPGLLLFVKEIGANYGDACLDYGDA